MNIIIIEDEKPAARLLKRRLEKLGYAVYEMLHSVEEAVNWLSQHPQPDLIMLDIQLSDGLSFEIFEKVKVESAIIFTTAYDEYVLKAFKLNSVDYLLKPIDEEELKFAIQKFINTQQRDNSIDLKTIQSLLKGNNEVKYKERFSIKVGTNIKIVENSQIECIYSENKVTYLFTNDKRNYLVDFTIESIEQQLNPAQFFRINRGQIIHIGSIKEINVYSNSRLKVILHHFDRDELIVSRERVNDFKNWLDGA